MGVYLKRSAPGPTVQQSVQQPTQLPASDPEDDFWRQALQLQQQKIDELDKAKPMYSPEEVQARRDTNQREYDAGLFGMLSGLDNVKETGALVFKNALANRQPKVTEKGSIDPFTGEYTYDPGYLKEKATDRYSTLLQARAAAMERKAAQQRHDQVLQAMARDRGRTQIELKTMGQGGMGANAGVFADPEGTKPLFRVKGGNGFLSINEAGEAVPHTGPVYPKPGSSNPSAEESNSAVYAGMMKTAMPTVDQFESQGTHTQLTHLINKIPIVGENISTYAQTPEQKQYLTAAALWIRAKLRRESGASISPAEFVGEYSTFFPMPNDPPELLKQKAYARLVATRSMEQAAGRARERIEKALHGDQPAGGNADDPLGLRPKK